MKTLLGTLIDKAKDNLGDYLISTSLCEMAIDRKKYESEVKSLTPQIFENIILVYIAKHELRYSQFLNHWNSELTTHLNAISDYTIKNDFPEKRRKVIIFPLLTSI